MTGSYQRCAAALLAAFLPFASATACDERFGHVERTGTGEATLILVPCLGCDWRSFDEFMARNAANYRMFAITWPGMADTALPVVETASDTPYWDYVLSAMKNLIESEDLERPVILGHSAAGPYVVDFARIHPELTAGVISVDATITNQDTLGYSRSQRFAWAEKEMSDVRAQFNTDQAWRDFNIRAAAGLGRRAQFYTDMWLAPPREHVFAYWLDWLKTDVGAMLSEIDVPLLSIYAIGTKEDPDAFKQEKQARFAANEASDLIQLAYVHPSGHTIWEYQPEEFDRLVAGFVAAVVSQRGE